MEGEGPLSIPPSWEIILLFPSPSHAPAEHWWGSQRLLPQRAGLECCCCRWVHLHCGVWALLCTYKIYFSVGRGATRLTDEQICWDSQDIKEIEEPLGCWRAEELSGHGSWELFYPRISSAVLGFGHILWWIWLQWLKTLLAPATCFSGGGSCLWCRDSRRECASRGSLVFRVDTSLWAVPPRIRARCILG